MKIDANTSWDMGSIFLNVVTVTKSRTQHTGNHSQVTDTRSQLSGVCPWPLAYCNFVLKKPRERTTHATHTNLGSIWRDLWCKVKWRKRERRRTYCPTNTLPANFWSDRQLPGWGKNSPIWAITRADLWSIWSPTHRRNQVGFKAVGPLASPLTIT